jgi:hypothetical protein
MRGAPALLLLCIGCKCLPVPTSDATPPLASIIVEYRVPGGQRVSRTLTQADGDVTVNASKNDNVTVVFSGSDAQGVRHVELVYDMYYYSGTTLVQPLLAPIDINVNCPKETLLNSHKFESDGHNYHYMFSSRATNWLGAATQSGKLTVLLQ